jgi:hypothetical protein
MSNFANERATIAESETFSLAAMLSARVCGNASSQARGGTVDCSETFTRTSLQQNEFSPSNVTANVSTPSQHIAENSEMEITNIHILMFGVTYQGRRRCQVLRELSTPCFE